MVITDNKFQGPFKISGNWQEQAKHLKTLFPQLTDSDLKWDVGKEHDLLIRIGTRLNKRREEVIKLIRENKQTKV
jgi:hypothetical protein